MLIISNLLYKFVVRFKLWKEVSIVILRDFVNFIIWIWYLILRWLVGLFMIKSLGCCMIECVMSVFCFLLLESELNVCLLWWDKLICLIVWYICCLLLIDVLLKSCLWGVNFKFIMLNRDKLNFDGDFCKIIVICFVNLLVLIC